MIRRTCSTLTLAVLVLAIPTALAAQTRVLVARLGSDTLSIERFTRTANTIAGTYLMHSPSTVRVNFTMSLRADGRVVTMEQTVTDGNGAPIAGQPTTANMRFSGDTVYRSMTLDGKTTSGSLAVPANTLPALGRRG